MTPAGRPALPLTRLAASAALVLVLATGCGVAEDVTGVDLDSIGEQVRSELDAAAGSIDDVTSALGEVAGLDDEARAAVEGATTSAGSAIDKARAALEASAAGSGAEVDAAVQEAQTALEDAQAELAAASTLVPDGVATALDALAAQITALSKDLSAAS